MTKVKRHRLPKRDKLGRARPVVGICEDGTRPKFTVATREVSDVEGERRLALIRRLYEKQCIYYGYDYWHSLLIAKVLATGEAIPDTLISDDKRPQYLATFVSLLQEWGMPVVVTQPNAVAKGITLIGEALEDTVKRLVAEELAKVRVKKGDTITDQIRLPDDPMDLTESATFHQALSAWQKHIDKTGKRDEKNYLSQYCQRLIDSAKWLKERHEDVPLSKLNLPAIDLIHHYWTNRPATAKGTRHEKSSVTDMLKCLWRFFRWLDVQPTYRWHIPRGADKLSRKPIDLDADDNGEAFQSVTVETYTIEELAVIISCADDFGKALICLCVNCAFGQSEVGKLMIKKISLYKAHPYASADVLNFDTSDKDSWVTGKRPKTKCYGEHLLWEPVARAIEPYINDGREVFAITNRGTPWWRAQSKNPQSKFNRWWRDLYKRVKKRHPDFRENQDPLPFGSLRDVLPNIIRRDYSDDIARICLQHKTPNADDLLVCYSNCPFGKLFETTRELEKSFEPLLTELKS